MLGGRVKTLHPRIHAGILARREVAGRHRGARRARDRAVRRRLREPLPVRARGGRAGCVGRGRDRDDRRRRAVDAASRREELRRCDAGVPGRGLRGRARRAARARLDLARDATGGSPRSRSQPRRRTRLPIARWFRATRRSRSRSRSPSTGRSTSRTARTRISAPRTTPSGARALHLLSRVEQLQGQAALVQQPQRPLGRAAARP